jgi:hypothetical protein
MTVELELYGGNNTDPAAMLGVQQGEEVTANSYNLFITSATGILEWSLRIFWHSVLYTAPTKEVTV